MTAMLLTPKQPTKNIKFNRWNKINSFCFSPDGKTILAACDDTAWLIDAKTSAQIRQYGPHKTLVQNAVFSPDGTTILTSSLEDRSVHLFDMHSTDLIKSYCSGTTRVFCGLFSPQGQAIVPVYDDNKFCLIDMMSEKKIQEFEGLSNLDERIRGIGMQFSKNGAEFLLVFGKTVLLFDFHTGALVWSLELPFSVKSAQFAPSDNIILIRTINNLSLFDSKTGEKVKKIIYHENELDMCRISDVDFSPDGKNIIVTTTFETSIRIFETKTGKQTRKHQLEFPYVFNANFFPDGERFIIKISMPPFRNYLQSFNEQTGKLVKQYRDYTWPVRRVKFSADGKTILTASGATARLFDAETGVQIQEFHGHESWVTDASFSICGKTVLTASADETVRLFDRVTGKEIRRFEGHLDQVEKARFSPDGKKVLAVASGANRIFDVNSGSLIKEFKEGRSSLDDALFSPDSEKLLMIEYHYHKKGWASCELINIQSGKYACHFEDIPGRIRNVTFSLDGEKIIVVDTKDNFHLFDVPEAHYNPAIKVKETKIKEVKISPDKRTVFINPAHEGEDLNEIETEKIWHQFEGHIAFWIDPQTGKDAQEHDDVLNRFKNFEFSPDGKTIVTGSDDGSIRIFDAETRELKFETVHFLDSFAVFDQQKQLKVAGKDAEKYFYEVIDNKQDGWEIKKPEFKSL